jgi:hypothetical protein
MSGDTAQQPNLCTTGKRKGRRKAKRKRGEQVQDASGTNVGSEISLDQCVDDIKSRISNAIVKDMNALCVTTFEVDKLPLLLALSRESRLQTSFWTSNFPPMIQFSPSHGCFEMFQTTVEELKNSILTLATRKTILVLTDIAIRPKQNEPAAESGALDGDVSSNSLATEVQQFTRSELCRFCSTVEDLRKSHPTVLWTTNYTLENNMEHKMEGNGSSSDEHVATEPSLDEDVKDDAMGISDKEKNTGDHETHNIDNSTAENSKADSEVRMIGSIPSSFWLQSDYQRMLAAHGNRLQDGSIIGLSVTIYSFSKSQPMKAITDCRAKFKSFFLNTNKLDELLPDKAESGTQYRICVMCRRAVEIRFRGPSEGSKHLQGRRLTVCGCAYCRECFRASAEQFTDDGDAVQCRNCKRNALARDDCQKIVGPNYKDKRDQFQQDLVNVHQKEWMNLLRKSERKYCAEILVNGGEYSNLHTCPDCSSHSVFNAHKPFFNCSYDHCSNVFCCKCLRVCSSLSGEQLMVCADRKCQKQEEQLSQKYIS